MKAEHDGARWRRAMWAAIAVLLLLPLVAMRFTDEVAWTAHDFAAAAVLLGGAGALYEVAARLGASPRRRALIGATLLAVVLTVWAHGAVGIF